MCIIFKPRDGTKFDSIFIITIRKIVKVCIKNESWNEASKFSGISNDRSIDMWNKKLLKNKCIIIKKYYIKNT